MKKDFSNIFLGYGQFFSFLFLFFWKFCNFSEKGGLV